MQHPIWFLCILIAGICLSCATSPKQGTPERAVPQSMVSEIPQGKVPELPPIPPIPEYIMGQGRTAPEKLASFLLASNPEAEASFVKDLAAIYVKEADMEGVNHDVAFAQMCLETGFLRYGNLVTPDMNNFCGLGSVGPGQPGEWFPDPQTGVRAQIQHLKGYATDAPLKQDLVDPRYRWVRYGSSPGIKGLAGTWSADQSYGDKIKNILERLYTFSFGEAS
ncbi:MAG: glucosaminidase domain-containing protein [Treponema sp.]|nr:glucosaminidase domain-containing protein [Treponema sp.]